MDMPHLRGRTANGQQIPIKRFNTLSLKTNANYNCLDCFLRPVNMASIEKTSDDSLLW